LPVNTIDEAIIEGIIQTTGSKFGMRAYKQLIKRKLGKTFAKRKHESTTIAIRGTLNAIKIVPCSEDSTTIRLNKEV
jgi:actin-like ATPase involved in cell morphogenesis